MNLTTFIIEYCSKHGISKTCLATHAKMSRSTLYNIMQDHNSPSLININKLAIAMQVHPQYLIQLEWNKQQLMGTIATPIFPLETIDLQLSIKEDDSRYIGDNLPCGTIVCTNETFTIRFRLQNTGKMIWKNRWLVCQDSEEVMPHPEINRFFNNSELLLKPTHRRIEIPTVESGEVVELPIEMTAPNVPMSVMSYWKMTDENGHILSPDRLGLFMLIRVISVGDIRA